MRFLRDERVLICGVLVLIGVAVMWHAAGYELGSLRRMGPGYFPLALGAILCLNGVMVLVEPAPVRSERPEGSGADLASRGRALGFVLGAILLFALLVRTAGFVPATALCLIMAGFATPENRFRDLVLLSAVITAFAVVVFIVGLGIPVPVVNF